MIFVILASILVEVSLVGIAPVEYGISFENAVHHEAQVTLQLNDLPEGPIELVMSRSSPGRYSIHNFAKNVYAFKAFDEQGEELTFTRPNPHEWHVERGVGDVKVEYTLFGDRVDGTYVAIDSTHVHLNMPAAFMWARGLEERPIALKVNLKKRPWTVATQLEKGKNKNLFIAPNLYYFMDSPLEAGPLAWRTWEVGGAKGTQTIRLAVHHSGTEEEMDLYAAMAQKVTAEQAAVFGGMPSFDYGVYTFLADYLAYASGDGMEHRNSTVLSSPRGLDDGMLRNLRTLSHEFFHAWSMERIRAKAVEPFNFESDNLSDELWFGEGFTNYYDDLVIHRAGLTTFDDYAKGLSERLNAVINGPGRAYFSAEGMSRQATFRDRGVAADRTNSKNVFISYYTFGDAIAVALDLTLRSNYELCLDDFMRAMWKRHGAPESPYTSAHLESVLASVTGDEGFARDFFARYVYGKDVMDYEGLLATAGLKLKKSDTDMPIMGFAPITYKDDTATLSGPTLVGSPLHKAGLDRDCKILELDGKPLQSEDDLNTILESHEPGDTVKIRFERRLEEIEVDLILAEDPTVVVVPYEHEEIEVTDAMKSFRKSWLSPKSTSPESDLAKECPECKRTYGLAYAFCHVDGTELKFSLPSKVAGDGDVRISKKQKRKPKVK
jgi:predicted metalloprotease with PDZ domain